MASMLQTQQPQGAQAHVPAHAHQFDDAQQQRESAELGMWLFLATEIMFFGGLFAGYAVYRSYYEDAFALASARTDLWLGTINTAVLLTSSLCMALAVYAAEVSRRGALVWSLGATIVLGAAFLAIKGYEWYEEYAERLVPLFNLRFTEELPNQAALFFNFYFAMTGLHAVHMIIGLVMLMILFTLARRGRLLGQRSTVVHVCGLYWHFVDIVWVFLFPLLYLVGAR